MSNQHTPGPWRAVTRSADHDSFYPDTEPWCVSVVLGGPLGLTLAHVNSDVGGHEESNAALIAAAPELLDVLKTTAGNIRSLGPAGALGSLPEPYTVWLAVVEAAIAKAEGRSE